MSSRCVAGGRSLRHERVMQLQTQMTPKCKQTTTTGLMLHRPTKVPRTSTRRRRRMVSPTSSRSSVQPPTTSGPLGHARVLDTSRASRRRGSVETMYEPRQRLVEFGSPWSDFERLRFPCSIRQLEHRMSLGPWRRKSPATKHGHPMRERAKLQRAMEPSQRQVMGCVHFPCHN